MKKTYLVHSGIKGQKWGVRRFQNEDGTLTSLGKQRYGPGGDREGLLETDYRTANLQGATKILEGTSKSANEAANVAGNIGKNKSKTINEKDYGNMSDEEIRTRINRLSMEKNYGELTGDTQRVRSGQDWTREFLQTTGAVVGIAGTIVGTILAIKQIQLVPKVAKEVVKAKLGGS